MSGIDFSSDDLHPKHAAVEHDHSKSYSHLSKEHRAVARKIILKGCKMLVNHKGAVHYTQDYAARWSGISQHRKISKGQIIHYGDCSSTATWLLWNALHIHFKLPDRVSGTHWTSGYTGTLKNFGKTIHHDSNIQVGDLIFYGTGDFHHVTVAVGNGKCFSHGNESAPDIWSPLDYMSERAPVKRYI